MHVARRFGGRAHLTSSLSLVHETGLAHGEHANHQAISLSAAGCLRNRDAGIPKATWHPKPSGPEESRVCRQTALLRLDSALLDPGSWLEDVMAIRIGIVQGTNVVRFKASSAGRVVAEV